jgi:hypothetical protein
MAVLPPLGYSWIQVSLLEYPLASSLGLVFIVGFVRLSLLEFENVATCLRLGIEGSVEIRHYVTTVRAEGSKAGYLEALASRTTEHLEALVRHETTPAISIVELSC